MKKGRDKRLIELRNRKLVERYYYWTEVQRRRFDDVLKILSSEEFFLSEQRIERLIRQEDNYLQELLEKGAKKRQLCLFKN